MRAGVDRDRPRTERGHEGVGEPEPVGRGRRDRCQEPGGVLEELRGGASGAACLGAADGMTADEPRVPARGGADGALRRADVHHRASLRARGRSTALHDVGQLRDRCCDDRERRSPRAPRPVSRPARTRRARRRRQAPRRRDPTPVTVSTPARLAARPTDAPISPVPTMESEDHVIGGRIAGAIMPPASARRSGTRSRATAAR